MDIPGIEVRPLKTMTGHAEFNETFFTNVRVPVDQIVGQRGQGWFVANATLGHERGMLGDPDALENRLQALIGLLQQESLGDGRAIDNEIGRASCRECGCQYGVIWVVGVSLKRKKPKRARINKKYIN